VVCLTTMLCFAVPQKNITKKTYGSAIADKVLSVDDGLVIRCNINQWPAIIGADISVKINGVVPKLAGDRIKDKKTQKDAKKFIADTLTAAKVIILTNIKRSRDFSIIADVIADNSNLADMLAEKNFALKVIDNVNDQQKTGVAAKDKRSGPTDEIHRHTCSQARRISEKNITRFDTKNAATQTGRRPCKTCKP